MDLSIKNRTKHENKTHGKIGFPYAVYHVKIPDFIDSFPLHWHEEIELIFVNSGELLITVQNTHYKAGNGDILIIAPQTIHSINMLKNTKCEYFNILFKFSMLASEENDEIKNELLLPIYSHKKILPVISKSGEKLNKLLTPTLLELIENRHQNYTGYKLMIKSLLFKIMYLLNENSIKNYTEEKTTQDSCKKIKTLLSHVHENYNRHISIEEAASFCCFSQSHFMKIFKTETGISFTKYLKNFRLEIAAAQLMNGNLKIVEIAGSTGFENLSYFTRAFYEKFRLTPREYRKKFIKKTQT